MHDALAERLLFMGGPPHRFQIWLGLIRAGKLHVVRRALLVGIVGWLPLVVLSAANGDFIRPDMASAFALDFSARRPPLLILAEAICQPRLAAIGREFVCAGLVPESQHDRYDYAVSSTRSLLNSTVVEIAAAVLAYAIVAALVLTKPINEVLGWHGGVSNGQLKVTPASRCRSA